MKKYILISLLLISFKAFSQVDTTEIGVDTIYIQEEPVIINKEIFIPYQKTEKSKLWYVSAGGGFGIANLSREASRDIYKNISYSFIQAGRILGKGWLFGLGLSSLNFKSTMHVNESILVQKERKSTITDTVDVYYEVINGNTTPVYVTESRDTIAKYNADSINSSSKNFHVSSINLPIQLRYRINAGKWILAPGVSFIACCSFNKKLIYNSDESKFRKVMFMTSLSMEVGREISDRFNFVIYGKCFKNISPVLHDRGLMDIFFITSGFRLDYFF